MNLMESEVSRNGRRNLALMLLYQITFVGVVRRTDVHRDGSGPAVVCTMQLLQILKGVEAGSVKEPAPSGQV